MPYRSAEGAKFRNPLKYEQHKTSAILLCNPAICDTSHGITSLKEDWLLTTEEGLIAREGLTDLWTLTGTLGQKNAPLYHKKFLLNLAIPD